MQIRSASWSSDGSTLALARSTAVSLWNTSALANPADAELSAARSLAAAAVHLRTLPAPPPHDQVRSVRDSCPLPPWGEYRYPRVAAPHTHRSVQIRGVSFFQEAALLLCVADNCFYALDIIAGNVVWYCAGSVRAWAANNRDCTGAPLFAVAIKSKSQRSCRAPSGAGGRDKEVSGIERS